MYKISNADRAQVLIQALPYIQKYSGQTIVVKYGGNAMVTPELKDAVMSDIVLMQLVGVNVVLVHGGGPGISKMLKKHLYFNISLIGFNPRIRQYFQNLLNTH